MKLLEGLLLLGAIVLFAWWQLRDVSKAQEDSARRRAANSQKPEPAKKETE